MKRDSKMQAVAYLTILLTIAGFLLVLYAEGPGVVKFILALLLMVACGMTMKNFLGMEGDWGMILLRTKRGLGMMDRLARIAPEFWKFCADIGIVIGFGLLSLFIFREIPRWRVIIGMMLLFFFSQLILPVAGPLALETINLPTGSAGLGSQAAAQAIGGTDSLVMLVFSMISYFVFLATMMGGLVLAGISGIAIKAFTVLLALSAFLASIFSGVPNGDALAGEAPGATFVLPGINIPLIEGILALAVLLVVHESAHGILARTLKIRLKSTGLVLFGILPAGAFVDPDEKQLESADPQKQNRILAAGSASNLATAVAFFFLLILFQSAVLSMHPTQEIGRAYVVVSKVSAGSPAEGFIAPGAVLHSWRGQNSTTIQQFINAATGTAPGEIVEIATDKGTLYLKADSNGKVGISVQQESYTFASWVRELSANGNPVPAFAFNFLALAFVLNVLVGIINLFPIPPFDGYRIVALACGKKKIFGQKLISLIIMFVVVCFALNLIPNIWS